MKLVKLTNRLKAIADLIGCGISVADIGTDHGYLPVYLAQRNSMQRIYASDKSDGSLNAAKRTADEYDVTDKIIFTVSRGLDSISPADVDVIVIAGMGGETIVDILRNTPWIRSYKKVLILQPQSKIDILFRFLYDNEYEINKIKYITDRKKHYTILQARSG